LISIIIPTLNEEKYIENTLKTIINQNKNNVYEIIVVDGGSEDDTINIAKKYTNNVYVIEKGVSKGRNIGANMALGDVLLFLDADTVIDPNSIDIINKTYQQNNVVGLSCFLKSSKKGIINDFAYWFFNQLAKSSCYLGIPLLAGIFLSCKKEVFKSIGGFDEQLNAGEDIDFSMKLRKFGKCQIIDVNALTSPRRLEKWGPVYFILKYFYGYIGGKLSYKIDYEPIR
jgi:glycosyltransferase involved in cell wall biosynthesis